MTLLNTETGRKINNVMLFGEYLDLKVRGFTEPDETFLDYVYATLVSFLEGDHTNVLDMTRKEIEGLTKRIM